MILVDFRQEIFGNQFSKKKNVTAYNSLIIYHLYLGYLRYKVPQHRYIGVYSWSLRLCTSISPRNDADEDPSNHERTSRVPLAGVLSPFLIPGAHHPIGQQSRSINLLAFLVADDGQLHYLKMCRKKLILLF